jgi:hypothetical protein
MAGVIEVLDKAWEEHHLKIDNDIRESERQQRRCYSRASTINPAFTSGHSIESITGER